MIVCGIAGICNLASRIPVQESALACMIERLIHRGPDQQGIYLAGPVGLVNTRLQIVDLVAGRQPMTDADSEVTLVYNGELWNHRELREALRRRGHTFTQESDTQVVLHAYLEFGERFAEHLDGMFGLAVWDAPKRRLVLVRDRLGKKPVYYTQTDSGDFIFASEIKALFCDPRVHARLDPQALADLLVLRYVPAPSTLFQGIRKLPPATVMVVDEQGIRQHTYWAIPSSPCIEVPPDDSSLHTRIRAAIRTSVQRRLVSEVPLGVLLSGGVDSSIIVAEASQLMSVPVRTFTVGFADEPRLDETAYARFVARRFRTDHHELTIDPQSLIDALPTVAWHRDEPMTEPTEIPTYLICRAAKPYATVLLAGEGADEIFAGYPKYAYDWLAGYTRHLPGVARTALSHSIDHLPERLRRVRIAMRSILQSDEARRWITWFGAFTDESKRGLMTRHLSDQVCSWDTSRIYRERMLALPEMQSLTRMIYLDMAIWLSDNLLMKGDKMSMAASVELRMPFLDRDLVTLAASVPPERLIRPFVSKYLLKEAYIGILPRHFLYRRKVGFRVPTGNWLRTPRLQFLEQFLTGDRARSRDLFRPESVERLISQHLAGTANNEAQLFVLLAVELWHRLYIDQVWSSAPAWDDVLETNERSIRDMAIGRPA